MDRLARKFYDLAIKEGEGLGTVYEYLVKYKLLNKILPKGRNHKVLVAGLPEKYGYSSDFFSFCEERDLDYEIIDERTDRIDRFKQIFKKTYSSKVSAQSCNLCVLDDIYSQRHFDLALSCEVLQRLSLDNQIRYIRSLKKIAKKVILFVPNGDSNGHQSHSGLNTVTMGAIIKQLDIADSGKHYDTGYIDMPPWPPGAKGSPLKSDIGRAICNISLNILQVISALEPFYPQFFKLKYSHLIYIVW